MKKPLPSNERKLLDAGYIPQAIDDLLALLARYDQTATFFIVGELFSWYPAAIEKIAEEGHEIAYHTHNHCRLTSAEIMKSELDQSTGFLSRFKPIGIRAPEIFATEDAIAVAASRGFKYSSSAYGNYSREPIAGIEEFSVSTIPMPGQHPGPLELPKHMTPSLLLREIPFGSGFFIALFGSLTSSLIHWHNRRRGPAIVFIHPWQLYQPPSIRGIGFMLKILLRNPLCLPYLRNISRCFEKLLQEHRFCSFRTLFYSTPDKENNSDEAPSRSADIYRYR